MKLQNIRLFLTPLQCYPAKLNAGSRGLFSDSEFLDQLAITSQVMFLQIVQ